MRCLDPTLYSFSGHLTSVGLLLIPYWFIVVVDEVYVAYLFVLIFLLRVIAVDLWFKFSSLLQVVLVSWAWFFLGGVSPEGALL